uniref:histone deacetylase 5-like n=1 Tax=Erigeron canadensis TaxID=72917 RepID=UPI001CB936E2|nr:histone deacetylase 5-like [Erigeron canadensis]
MNTIQGSSTEQRRRVGLVYDERMCKHYDPCDENHEECPGRILSIWNKLTSTGLTKRCLVFGAKEVDEKYISAVHTNDHVDLIKTISSNSERNDEARGYSSVYFNDGSSESAYLAAGSVVEAAEKVAKGELNSAFAIVRPPGHQAEDCKPMGFCLFNNVAIATSFLLNQKELGINKILIVDWDVHHGNGTQKMFYDDPRVLYFSVHRHDSFVFVLNGKVRHERFYPGGDNGSHIMTGSGQGLGYNINVPWLNGGCGDADYITVWNHILIPVAREFKPDVIMVSAGFDAAMGDPLGGCCVTPKGYALMLQKLMEFSSGKIVMALEGGYNLESTSNSVHACMEVLLDNKPIDESVKDDPLNSTWE